MHDVIDRLQVVVEPGSDFADLLLRSDGIKLFRLLLCCAQLLLPRQLKMRRLNGTAHG